MAKTEAQSIRDRLIAASDKLRDKPPGEHVITFGKIVKSNGGKAMTIDAIAKSARGLLWLDWAADGLDPGPDRDAIQAYTSLESIQWEIRDLIDAVHEPPPD